MEFYGRRNTFSGGRIHMSIRLFAQTLLRVLPLIYAATQKIYISAAANRRKYSMNCFESLGGNGCLWILILLLVLCCSQTGILTRDLVLLAPHHPCDRLLRVQKGRTVQPVRRLRLRLQVIRLPFSLSLQNGAPAAFCRRRPFFSPSRFFGRLVLIFITRTPFFYSKPFPFRR